MQKSEFLFWSSKQQIPLSPWSFISSQTYLCSPIFSSLTPRITIHKLGHCWFILWHFIKLRQTCVAVKLSQNPKRLPVKCNKRTRTCLCGFVERIDSVLVQDMKQIVQEQQWQTWNCTYWSANLNPVIHFQEVYAPLCSLCVLGNVWCSLLKRQICRRAKRSLRSPRHSLRSLLNMFVKAVGWLQIWFSPFCLRCDCCFNCFACAMRRRAENPLCPWLRQQADSKSSIIVIACVFALSPQLSGSPGSGVRDLSRRDSLGQGKTTMGGENSD